MNTRVLYRVLISMGLIGAVCAWRPVTADQKCFSKKELVQIDTKLVLLEACQEKQIENLKIIDILKEQKKSLSAVLGLQTEKEAIYQTTQKTLMATIELQSKALKDQADALKWDWKSFAVGLTVGLVTAGIIAGVTAWGLTR